LKVGSEAAVAWYAALVLVSCNYGADYQTYCRNTGRCDGGNLGIDSGAQDSGLTDAGATDSGTPDASTSDANQTSEGGTPDSGTADAGSTDAGAMGDSGACPTCPALFSALCSGSSYAGGSQTNSAYTNVGCLGETTPGGVGGTVMQTNTMYTNFGGFSAAMR
jgi:hypothetical protein